MGIRRKAFFFILILLNVGMGVFLRSLSPSNISPIPGSAIERQSTVSSSPPVSERVRTILFAGDIMLSRGVGTKIRASGDFRFPFLRIASAMQAADLAFANLEGPISDRGEDQGSVYSFRADPKTVEGLSYAGFDVLSLANNHILDWGPDALSQTIDILRAADIGTVGAGRNETEANEPAIFYLAGIKIGFLAYTTLMPESFEARGEHSGISYGETASMESAVRTLKERVDLLVVSMHWGDEYEMIPNEAQRLIGHVLIDAGADLVLGHHPHVIQEVERYKDGWIAYSLGNFVFDQNFSAETMQGLLLRADIRDARIENVVSSTVYLDENFMPSPAL